MTATPDPGAGRPAGTPAAGPTDDAASGPSRAAGATGVGLASLVAAGSGYVVIVLAARVLDEAENADFLAFWGLLFFCFGALGGMQSEVTRSSHVARTTPGHRGPRVLPLGLLIGAVLAGAIAMTSPLWAHAVLGADPWPAVAVVVLAVVAFAGHSAVAGALAGQGRWTTYARVVAAAAVVRLVLAVVAALVVTDASMPVALRVATGAAAATWLVLSIGPAVRAAWRQEADVSPRRFASASAQAMLGAASSAALVVGFPVLLTVTTPPDVYAGAAPIILAVQLTRAPLLIPLTAYQGMAITYVLGNRDRGVRPLLRVAGLVAAAGAVAAVAAALVGPWLMALVLGPGYRVDGLVLGGLTLTAALLALLTLTGAATLALDGHRAYAVGWCLASLTSALVLLVPGPLAGRVVLSLALGPLVGLAVHVAHVGRALRTRR